MMDISRAFPLWENLKDSPSRITTKEWATELLMGALDTCGLPIRYWEASLLDFPECHAMPVARNGMGYYLHGKRSEGKTHCAAALVKQWIFDNYKDRKTWNCSRPLFVSVPMLTLTLRASFSNAGKGPDEGAIINNMIHAPLLVLDDLGREQPTEYVQTVLYVIINERYNRMQPTVITSNFNLDDLAPIVGEALTHRISEMCIPVLMGQDQ